MNDRRGQNPIKLEFDFGFELSSQMRDQRGVKIVYQNRGILIPEAGFIQPQPLPARWETYLDDLRKQKRMIEERK